MGYDAYHKVAVGFIFDESDIKNEKRVRSCNHDTDLSKKFCAECGKPVFTKKDDNIFEEEDTFPLKVKGQTFKIQVGRFNMYDKYIIGIMTSTKDTQSESAVGMTPASLPDLVEFEKVLRVELENKGLAVHSNFGIYSLISHSC